MHSSAGGCDDSEVRVIYLLLLGTLALTSRTDVTDAEVAQVQESVLLIDTHNDTPMKVIHIHSTANGLRKLSPNALAGRATG